MAHVDFDLTASNVAVPNSPQSVVLAVVVNPDGSPVSSGGGGSSDGLTNAQLRASPVPVSGPVTNAQFAAIEGTASQAAWDGVAPSATVIQILKAVHAQNAQIITLLSQIATNTTPAG